MIFATESNWMNNNSESLYEKDGHIKPAYQRPERQAHGPRQPEIYLQPAAAHHHHLVRNDENHLLHSNWNITKRP